MPPSGRVRKRDYGVFSEDWLEDDDVRVDSGLALGESQSLGRADVPGHCDAEESQRTRAGHGIDADDASPQQSSVVSFDEDVLYRHEDEDDIFDSQTENIDTTHKTPSTVKLPPAPPLHPYEASSFDDDDDDDRPLGSVNVDIEVQGDDPKASASRSQTSIHEEWTKHYREDYLREMIWLEGRAGCGSLKYCTGCGGEGGFVYRCTSCVGAEPLCKPCIVAIHQRNPFHFIEVWNGSHYEPTTLKQLGLCIQLGHPPGRSCGSPQRSHNDDFVVLDTTGIHEVTLRFCGCDGLKPRHIQLLRYKLFPGTPSDPRSACTFRALKFFQILSFESKGSHEEFYRAVVRLTGNVKFKASRDRYHEFLEMVSQWRHLKMLKRAGRAHDTGGIKGTSLGDCALRCPACPQPGVNLPDNWESAPPEKRWIYRLFVAIDGNFRLKRRMVSSDERDPGLNEGWSYFVEEKRFRKHLLREWDSKQERSTCVAHDAVDKPDRQAKGLAASGVVAIVCTRHEFKLPNGVGDLQKGEKYINVDFISFSGIRWFKIREIVISYDIACQWHKKLMERLGKLPRSIQPSHLTGVIILIPKFHLPAHIEYCNRTYSFNLTPGVGRSDGEAPERGWSRMNTAGKSTTEMGPGKRRDTLDDHFGDGNYKIIQRMCDALATRMIRAVAGKDQHAAAFKDFAESIPDRFKEAWKQAVENWEGDQANSPNPFEAQTKGVSEQAIRLQLAREAEEAEKAKESNGHTCDSGVMHPSLFISLGVQLEEDQHKLHIAASSLGNHPTKKQLTTVAERSTTLRRRIAVWIDVQNVYVREAAAARRQHDDALTAVEGKPSSEAYDIPLFLPSSLPPSSCPPDLIRYEVQLREGQAYDALNDVRRYLRLRSYLLKRKDAHSRGVAQNTRSNTAIQRAQKGINLAANKYDRAYTALLALCGKTPAPGSEAEGWRKDLRVLKLTDIRGLSEGMYGETEGTREISWIWKSRSAPASGSEEMTEDNIEKDEQLQDALRIEYLRCRARAMRWDEEVTLLQEEMRRTLQSFKYKMEWWSSRQKSTIGGPDSDDYVEGFAAYALSQCSVYQTLYRECQARWAEGERTKWVKPKRYAKKGVAIGSDGTSESSTPIVVDPGAGKIADADVVDPYDEFD